MLVTAEPVFSSYQEETPCHKAPETGKEDVNKPSKLKRSNSCRTTLTTRES